MKTAGHPLERHIAILIVMCSCFIMALATASFNRKASATECYSSYRTASVVSTYRDQIWSPNTAEATHHIYDQTYKTIQYWDGYYLSSTNKYVESSTQMWTCWYCVNNWSVY